VRAKRAEEAKKAGVFRVELLHRAVPVVKTAEGLRAVGKEAAGVWDLKKIRAMTRKG
jgi:hypothetical protein